MLKSAHAGNSQTRPDAEDKVQTATLKYLSDMQPLQTTWKKRGLLQHQAKPRHSSRKQEPRRPKADISAMFSFQKTNIAKKRLTFTVSLFFCGEGGSRTYRIIENHKISIRCKLSVYKIVKFIETHREHFDI